MKFIHCADLHLESSMDSKLSTEKARKRRNELFESFARLADRAESEKARAILIAGDIFDKKKVPLSSVKKFVKIVCAHPEVDFLCISGNHDCAFDEMLEEQGHKQRQRLGS